MAFFSWLDDQSDITAILFHNPGRFNPLNAATQNILVMARDLGLGSVWVAGDKKDYCEKILKALNVPAGAYRLISLVCVGYPEEKFPVTPKKDIKETVHWESF